MSELSTDFSVSIGLDNDAFQDGNAGIELARILRKVADMVESHDVDYLVDMFDSTSVRDVNGNTVGSVYVR